MSEEIIDTVIVHYGAHTPVGIDAVESISSCRAGLTRLTIYPEYEDKNWKPVTVGSIGYIPDTLDYSVRFIDICWPALEEALNPFEKKLKKPLKIPVLIGMPEPRPGLPDSMDSLLLDSVKKLGRIKDLNLEVQFIPKGHSSGLLALHQAKEMIENQVFDYVMIGGVDSYLDNDTLTWLEESGRLMCSYNENGFIPGEAAAFCLLASQKTIENTDISGKARVVQTSCTEEKNTLASKQLCLGAALTQAIQTCLAGLKDGELVDQVFCGLNGEDYPSREWGYSSLRLRKKLDQNHTLNTGTGSWGDVGAATGPLSICHAVHSGEWGYADGPLTLLFTSSLGTDRAATLLNITINQERKKKWRK